MKTQHQKSILIFPPLASPTYVPLGLASLAAYIKRELPRVELTVFDSNIDAWHSALAQHGAREEIWSFLKNVDNSFYNEDLYQLNLGRIWREMKDGIVSLLDACRRYLEQDELSAGLKHWLERETARILPLQPDYICLSVMYPQQLFFALALTRYLKEQLGERTGALSSLKIFLGGATLSAVDCVELLTACSFLDAILPGEGEEGIKLLLSGTPYEAVPGLLYRQSGSVAAAEGQSIQKNPAGCALELPNLPAPDFSVFPLPKYFNPQPVLPVLFSRGCRWRKCRFCAHNFSFARYRQKKVSDLVTELENYQERLGAEHFYFADQYLDTESLELLADELLKRNLPVAFHFMGRPAGGYSRKLMAKLFAAGCRWISWGIETGSQRLLEITNKGTNREEILRILKEAHECGINNLAMMIFGLPTGTNADLEETFDFLERAAPSLTAMTESEFILYKHTPFANAAGKYGLKITGEEVLCRIKGFPIHSHRLTCRSLADPAGELARWHRRKPWLLPPRLYDKLSAEHYLLYATHHSRLAVCQLLLYAALSHFPGSSNPARY